MNLLEKIDKKIMIYGSGEFGLLTYEVLRNEKACPANIVCFIDYNQNNSQKQLKGLNIFNFSNITKEFIENKQIDEIIISIPDIKPIRLIEISEICTDLSVVVKIVPESKYWIDGNFKYSQIKKLQIDDLLGRAPIKRNNPILKKEFKNKVVLVTGAAGSVGSEISKQISSYKYQQLILVDQAESDLYELQQYFQQKGKINVTAVVADIRNKKRMDGIFNLYKPELIFHAAAYKHVPFMEANPSEAVSVNIEGTQIIADLAVAYNVSQFVLISTDKAVNPSNIMGASKRIAEIYIQSLSSAHKTKFIITRFGNVLGSNGSVIPLFKKQIENGGPITLTHKEITRYFMTISQACQLVLEAGAMGNGGEIFVFNMGESIKIFDLAVNLIHLSSLKYPEDIKIKIIGLRPGEKICEELLASGENVTSTPHKKLMIATMKKIEMSSMNENIKDLCLLNQGLNSIETVKKMKNIIPEFISNNSEYEQLDEN